MSFKKILNISDYIKIDNVLYKKVGNVFKPIRNLDTPTYSFENEENINEINNLILKLIDNNKYVDF